MYAFGVNLCQKYLPFLFTAERLVRNLYYNTSSVTWKEAEIACNQDRNSSLLPLTTESDRNFVSAIRRKFHPGAIWVGDYKVLEDTFVPHDGLYLFQAFRIYHCCQR